MRLTFHPFIVRQISSEGTGEIKGFSPEYINSFFTHELTSVNVFAPLIRVDQSLRKWNHFLAGFPAYQQMATFRDQMDLVHLLHLSSVQSIWPG